ncbi:hypothetical protein PTTG_29428 [Puccinia triticina 1-1 BBBD Race 1]|uniref:ATP-dependent DNA helicase n=1 Tax=Puccinia triticina (isolate 1-1 / race 1 (BBBD)) TaxID=630390 RepID=A0A180G473_PUCT1|nr:hypothetical protein PTTG_29428 [Puccinia triticina 1-1 BBBD Race 1]
MDFFTQKLNQLAKWVRDTTEPFDGIQLILTGDFFQLPPITRLARDAKRAPYLFESKSWDECVTQTIFLKHVFRQSDQVFVDLLNEIWMGTVLPRTSEIMASLTKPVKYEDDILPTELSVPLSVSFLCLHLGRRDLKLECAVSWHLSTIQESMTSLWPIRNI